MQPKGYASITHPDSPLWEADTFTCSHCNKVVFIKPKEDMGGFCRMCYANICGPCADLGSCTPFEKKLEAMERRTVFYTELGIK